MPGRQLSNRIVLFYAFCALLSLFVYSRAFDNPFRQDDFVFLTHVEAHAFPDVLVPGPGFAFFRPGAVALFSLEHAWFGRHSGAYIVFNYALHAVISVLLFFILRSLGGGRVALLASGLFLAGFGHYGKQVMWACTSGPLASVLLSLVSILIILRSVKQEPRAGLDRRGGLGWPPLVAFVLLAVSALFHEGSLAASILIVILVTVESSHRLNRKYALLFLALIPAALAAWLALAGRYPAYHAVGLREAVANAPVHLLRFLGFMVLPLQPTTLIEGSPVSRTLVDAAPLLHVAVGAVFLLALLYLAFLRRGMLRVLAAWLLLALMPFTVLQYPTHHMDLRYLYPAAIPFCALAAITVVSLWERGGLTGRILGGGIALLALAGSTVLQLLLENRYDQWR